MAEVTMAELHANLLERLLDTAGRAVEDLSVDELGSSPGGRTNSIGFDVWHVVRTVDNVIHFVFEREQPVWLSGGFQERWGLPKVDQGTGMTPEDAYALQFPEAEEFVRYVTAVREAVVPRVRAMSDEYLGATARIMPWGELARSQIIGQVLISHGNGHLGRVDYARALLGKSGLGY